VKERGGLVGATIVAPPDGELTILFSDITRAASLWEFNASAMKEATLLHNQLLRSLLSKYRVPWPPTRLRWLRWMLTSAYDGWVRRATRWCSSRTR
jgi:hypothetical protein